MNKLYSLTLQEALLGLKEGKFTSTDLVTSCLNRIKDYDHKIQAFITVCNESALAQAKEIDRKIATDKTLFEKMPLAGIPYACKDNFSTIGIETTAASNILRGYVPPYESTVTDKLKAAGAILLGKTNMDAFAHGASTETSDFFPTKNPWNTSKLPGGSSGGSTAAVSANMCIFAIGSDTGGSIRCPASWCGVTGLKPTYGRVSRYGVIAMASSTDSPGPITKSAYDAALVLQVIAGKDPFDSTSANEKVDDYIDKVSSFSPRGLRIGRPTSYFNVGAQDGVLNAVNEGFKYLEKLGCEIVDIDLLHPKYAIADYTIVQRAEVSSNLARFDGIRFGHQRTTFGFEARKRMMLGAYALSAGYYDQYYSKAQKVRTLIIEEFNRAFSNVDLIAGPNMPTVAVDLGSSESSPIFGELTDMMQLPGAMAGLSVISIPSGFSEGLPVGMQIIGQRFNDASVLGLSHAFQEITDFHKQFPELEDK